MPLLTTDEQKRLLATLATMGIQPEDGDPDAIRTWMLEYLDNSGGLPQPKEEVKEEDVDKGEGGDKEKGKETKTKLEQDMAAMAAVARSINTPLRLPTFSGEEGVKGETTFDLWKYEVECLLKEDQYSEDAIRQAIRKSVKGEAARIVKRQGTEATMHQLLDQLDAVYGIIGAGQSILAEFYAARQGTGETVASWSCRLENLLDKALQLEAVNPKDTEEMLRSRFWLGLRSTLRNVSRHKYETVKDFNRLRREMRVIEQENLADQGEIEEKAQKVKTSKMATAKESQEELPSLKEFRELKGLVQQLTNSFKDMQTQQKKQGGSQPAAQAKANTGSTTQGSTQQEKVEGATGSQSGGSTGQQGCWNCGSVEHRKYQCPLLPECFKCHRRGHVQKYCRLNGK